MPNGKVNIGPFMEFLSGSVIQGAADGYATYEITVPASLNEKLAVLIHFVEWGLTETMDAPAAGDYVRFQLTKNLQTAVLSMTNTDLVLKGGLVANGASEGKPYEIIPLNPPILYSKSKIHFGFDSVGQAAAKTGEVRIGYTIEKVSESAFIAALTE